MLLSAATVAAGFQTGRLVEAPDFEFTLPAPDPRPTAAPLTFPTSPNAMTVESVNYLDMDLPWSYSALTFARQELPCALFRLRAILLF